MLFYKKCVFLTVWVLTVEIHSYTEHHFISDLFEEAHVHKACKLLGNNWSIYVPKLELCDYIILSSPFGIKNAFTFSKKLKTCKSSWNRKKCFVLIENIVFHFFQVFCGFIKIHYIPKIKSYFALRSEYGFVLYKDFMFCRFSLINSINVKRNSQYFLNYLNAFLEKRKGW